MSKRWKVNRLIFSGGFLDYVKQKPVGCHTKIDAEKGVGYGVFWQWDTIIQVRIAWGSMFALRKEGPDR